MLKKLNNESVTILSAVASGLVVDALYPSISNLVDIVGNLIMDKNQVDEWVIELSCAGVNVILVFLIFFMIWKLCTYCIPSYIRFYEIHKKIRYIPKTSSEEISLFYKVFIETMSLKIDNKLNISSCHDDFYIVLNKTLDLSNRLILATAKHKDPIVLNIDILRTATKNHHYVNYRKYINSYELNGTIDSLLFNLDELKKAYDTLKFKNEFMINDIANGISRLEELKKQIPE